MFARPRVRGDAPSLKLAYIHVNSGSDAHAINAVLVSDVTGIDHLVDALIFGHLIGQIGAYCPDAT